MTGISFHPHRLPADFDAEKPFRYFVGSRTFQQRFANVSEVDVFNHVRSYCANRRGGQLGASDLLLSDDNGLRHLFHFETFFNQYEALTLGIYKRAHTRIVTVGS
jgi:hypothetical protein